MADEYATVTQAATQTGLPENYLLDQITKGKLGRYRRDGVVMVKLVELGQLMDDLGMANPFAWPTELQAPLASVQEQIESGEDDFPDDWIGIEEMQHL